MLWGAQIKGEWLDTGRTEEEAGIILGNSEQSRQMGKVFGIQDRIGSIGSVGRGYESVVEGTDVEVAADSIQIRSYINGGKVRLASGSQVYLVSWEGDLELEEGSVMSEGAVRKEEGNGWVVQILWDTKDSPKDGRSHYGYEIKRWLDRLKVAVADVFPDGKGGILGEKGQVLLNAKIFPGVSMGQEQAGGRHTRR